MFKQFLKKWIVHVLIDAAIGAGVLFFVWMFFLSNDIPVVWLYLPAIFVVVFIAAYQAAGDLAGEYKKRYQEQFKEREKAQAETKLWKQSLIEKSAGFPTLLRAIDEYEKIKDEKVEQYLRNKSHPARKSAEVVREETQRRRLSEYERKKTQAIIEYYESIFPFLANFKDDIASFEDDAKYRDYDEEEQIDPATHYLVKEEFRKLTSTERNQLALDRFWSRPKSNWLLGRIYERYIGYLYEKRGYSVYYQGIIEGYEDLGRDLIATKGNDVEIIQCKYWSQEKTIHEKHIFQLFGTTVEYWVKNGVRQNTAQPSLFPELLKQARIKPIFITSTKLSEKAREFADVLGIHVQENTPFQRYPCVKCNVSMRNGEKIYHLPFDQQYDRTLIKEEKNERYVETVKEAEALGFRRAFRWHGTSETSETDSLPSNP
jgi:hypothetical protein